MIMKGQKRKLPSEDEEVSDRSSPNWESQRQFVFSVSLVKYQRGQELPEPSLRRSVLIANTLRQISLEDCTPDSREDETSQPPCSSSSAPQAKEEEIVFTTVTAAKHHSAVTVANSSLALGNCLQVSPNAAQWSYCASFDSSASNGPLPIQDEDEDWGSTSTDFDFSLSAAISSILTALDSTIDGTPQAASRTSLRSLENLSWPSEGGVAGSKQGVRVNGSTWEQQAEFGTQEASLEVISSSYLGNFTMEDPFRDIDTSLLERDMGALGLKGSGSGYLAEEDLLWYLPPFSPSSSSLCPLSLSLNQNLRCLPTFSSFNPSSSSTSLSSPPPASSFSGQSHVKGGLDLECLMEVES
ncbi:Cell division cycle-associated protein 4 Hematopoietic progenitor protein [Channa argus]|uniref:Cell division cycle-associated protein 4 Hematopoietic progenitor protein n=1 Tax=Channa argus TaxID=215402 RepID=A0A6G1PTK1_CHAAH|nr:Cell division cycle-associated protein 4 Hematopoietic progenitor protein [Channa argus]